MPARETEQYGYSLIKLLADHGLEIDQGTLYPLLRGLETQGLLKSKWRIEDPRPRRYYVLSKLGVKVLPLIKAEWSKLSALIKAMYQVFYTIIRTVVFYPRRNCIRKQSKKLSNRI